MFEKYLESVQPKRKPYRTEWEWGIAGEPLPRRIGWAVLLEALTVASIVILFAVVA